MAGLEDEPLPPGTESVAGAASSASASGANGAEKEAGKVAGEKTESSRKEGKSLD